MVRVTLDCMKPNQDILSALDAFVRKYYKNLLIRGVLYAVGIVVGLYLAAVLLEHFGWLSPVGRGLIFWIGLAAVAAVTAWLVVRPLLKMYGVGKRIGREEAARIIGRHFPEVDDKLLNLLQLMDESSADSVVSADSDLLLAAVEQKTAQLRPVPFLSAINLKGNRRYLKYALPPLAVLILLLILAPQTVTEPSKRIVNYQTVYERPAPFHFRVLNSDLTVQQGGDYLLEAVAEAEKLEASEEEIAAQYDKLAGRYGVKAEDVKAAISEDRIIKEVKSDKASKLVLENAVAEAPAEKPDQDAE